MLCADFYNYTLNQIYTLCDGGDGGGRGGCLVWTCDVQLFGCVEHARCGSCKNDMPCHLMKNDRLVMGNICEDSDGLLIKTTTVLPVLKNRTPFERTGKKQTKLRTFSDSSEDGHRHNTRHLSPRNKSPVPTEQTASSLGQSVESLPPPRSGFQPRLVPWDMW